MTMASQLFLTISVSFFTAVIGQNLIPPEGTAAVDVLKHPLIFDYVRGDAARVKVFWSPLLRPAISKVVELSNRDIRLIRNNQTGELEEMTGDWHPLVTTAENDAGDRRYIFLKKTLCHEVDWRASWSDESGATHGPVIQRLSSSPIPWSPNVQINLDSKTFDPATDMISAKISYTIDDDRLPGAQKLNLPRIKAELKNCESLFKGPVSLPVLKDNTLLIPADYARHFCSLWIRLTMDTVNEELNCRDAQQTSDEKSLQLDLYCTQFEDMSCTRTSVPPLVSKDPDCEMDCSAEVFGKGRYEYDGYGIARPVVDITWLPRIADRPINGYLVRHAQIDRTWNNYPIKEFNVTAEVFDPANSTVMFEQYSRDMDASYGVQACVLYSDGCKVQRKIDEVPWTQWDQHQISFNHMISTLPPPTTTTLPPTTTTTTPPALEKKPNEGNEPKHAPELFSAGANPNPQSPQDPIAPDLQPTATKSGEEMIKTPVRGNRVETAPQPQSGTDSGSTEATTVTTFLTLFSALSVVLLSLSQFHFHV